MIAIFISAVASIVESMAVILIIPLVSILSGAGIKVAIIDQAMAAVGLSATRESVPILLAAVLGAFLIKDVVVVAFRWWFLGFTMRHRSLTAIRLFRYYLNAPYSLHTSRSSSELLQLMGPTVGSVFAYTVTGFVTLCMDAVTILLISSAVLAVAPGPTLAVAAYFAVGSLIFLRVIQRAAHSAGGRQQEAARAGYRAAFHGFGGIKEIQLRGAQDFFAEHYTASEMENARASRVAAFLGEMPKYVLEIMLFIGLGGALVFLSATGGADSILAMVAVLAAAAFRILPSASRLVGAATGLRIGKPSIALLLRELDAADAQEQVEVASAPTPFRQDLVVDRVSFRYGPDLPDVVDDVTLSLPAGTSMALVGGSGAGKSTLVDIIMGFHAPTSGRVVVDGVDVGQDIAAWRQNIAMVPQDVYLLEGSLAENIAFDEAVDPVRLHQAIVASQLGDLVATLPAGVDTPIGERGSRLSGGQRQRVGIARALYRRPTLLVLDEATSALDNDTERQITSTIEALRGRVTTIVVAHRLSTVRHVDQLVFLSQGRVAATGSFDEVRDANEEFARLVKLGSLTGIEGMEADHG
ncbi:ABC transporter ATP-binding protein [Janibacter massiliensis]|uniref:ABC transporter ATP-binding protein n=1 Tax=Janibacter massiliensis TaxID=2058291 RepID=UPI00131A4EA3|nr:ABC transporter ATP-binding protein [Janibacter massiliensis]